MWGRSSDSSEDHGIGWVGRMLRGMKRDAIRWIALFAAAKLLFHLWSNGLYGFHRDELATLDDARHLAWGYVAYPPLTPLLGRIELELFGATPGAFRFFASLAQAIAIVITAMMTKRLGGGRAAQWIAALAVAISPISLAASALFQYVAFDFLWWVLIAYFVVRLVESDDPRWWMAIGAVIGLGALTKYTIAFCVAGIVAGVLATDLRRHLRGRWLWIGVAISIAIALPHLLWEASHGFVTLDFVRHVHARDMRIGRTQDFLLDQLRVASNPVTLPLWIVGLIAVLQSRRFRILAWMVLVPFALFSLAQGRGYYTGPLYPVLFAAGSVITEQLVEGRRRVAYSAMALLFVIGCAVVPIAVPLAPPSTRFFKVASSINNDLREEIGWPEMAREVDRIRASLSPEERVHSAALCANYGEAGALSLYGHTPVLSGANSFWARGYGDPPPRTVIVLGFDRTMLERHFTEVALAGRIPNPYDLDNEESQHPEIYVCRGLREPWPQFWRRIRSFG